MDEIEVGMRGLIIVAMLLVGVLALVLRLRRLLRWGKIEPSKAPVRRAAGHAMLGFQEFVEPSVEYILQAQNVEQKEEDDLDSDGDDREQILSDLSTSLGRDPVDHEEVRRHLAYARRAGLDWREVYESALESELAARPFRSPSLPPIWKVAPRE